MYTAPMRTLRHSLIVAAAAVLFNAPTSLAAQQSGERSNNKEQEAKRPKVLLRAQPQIAIAPARVVLSAELQGGPDDFEEFYCPSIEWQWGDDTSSESTADCEPFEPGKSQIKRRYTVQHVFRREGVYKVSFRLKRKDKVVGTGTVTVQVQAGGRPPIE
jgi:hypothetical protein